MIIHPITPDEVRDNKWTKLSKNLIHQAVNNLIFLNYDDTSKWAVFKESELILEYLSVTGQENTRENRKAIYESNLLNFESVYEKDWEVRHFREIEPIDEVYEPYYVFMDKEQYNGNGVKTIETGY